MKCCCATCRLRKISISTSQDCANFTGGPLNTRWATFLNTLCFTACGTLFRRAKQLDNRPKAQRTNTNSRLPLSLPQDCRFPDFNRNEKGTPVQFRGSTRCCKFQVQYHLTTHCHCRKRREGGREGNKPEDLPAMGTAIRPVDVRPAARLGRAESTDPMR